MPFLIHLLFIVIVFSHNSFTVSGNLTLLLTSGTLDIFAVSAGSNFVISYHEKVTMQIICLKCIAENNTDKYIVFMINGALLEQYF